MKRVAATIRVRAEVRADERVRIARDLHDTLLQGVQGLTLHFHVAAQALPDGSRTREAMERALVTADRILVEGRNRVKRLRAEDLTPADLSDAFEAVAGDFNHEQRVRFALSIEGQVEDVTSPIPARALLHRSGGNQQCLPPFQSFRDHRQSELCAEIRSVGSYRQWVRI